MRASSSSSSALEAVAAVLVLIGVFGASVALCAAAAAGDGVGGFPAPRAAPSPPIASIRKLLAEGGGGASTQRVDDRCTAEDVVIYQGTGKPQPNGMPVYTVDVINECVAADGNCAIGGIHLRCGWFASVRLVDPRLFRRLAFNDCLLNDGRPLRAGDSVSFTYTNSFPYKMSVASASCLGTP